MFNVVPGGHTERCSEKPFNKSKGRRCNIFFSNKGDNGAHFYSQEFIVLQSDIHVKSATNSVLQIKRRAERKV